MDLIKLKDLCESNREYGYTEFCRLIEVPIQGGGSNAQKKQLKDLTKYCTVEKVGRKYRFSNYNDALALSGIDKIKIYNFVGYDDHTMIDILKLKAVCDRNEFLTYAELKDAIGLEYDTKLLHINQLTKYCEAEITPYECRLYNFNLAHVNTTVEIDTGFLENNQGELDKNKDGIDMMLEYCIDNQINIKTFISAAIGELNKAGRFTTLDKKREIWGKYRRNNNEEDM